MIICKTHSITTTFSFQQLFLSHIHFIACRDGTVGMNASISILIRIQVFSSNPHMLQQYFDTASVLPLHRSLFFSQFVNILFSSHYMLGVAFLMNARSCNPPFSLQKNRPSLLRACSKSNFTLLSKRYVTRNLYRFYNLNCLSIFPNCCNFYFSS